METHKWLEQLRGEFARRNLPPLYVERFVAELSDHLHDFLEDRMSTDARDLRGIVDRLGTPGQIAATAASEYRKQRYAGRHPIITFVVLPILSLPALWFVLLAAVLLLAKIMGFTAGQPAPGGALAQWAEWCLPTVLGGVLLAAIGIAAAFFCRLAQRAAMHWKWAIGACSILAIVGGAAIAKMTLPHGGQRGTLVFGFGVSDHPSLAQIAQFAVPLMIGAYFAWRQAVRESNAWVR